jgi:4-amino-4-deoxy-L-arabinose transferase-like glycosyltransferase
LGALSILQGQGIFFGAYTDKPLYMSFLAGLHLLAGYNYTELVLLQICFLALMAPALYFIGKSFHSRPLGILMALVLLLRQRNAILLTGVLYYNAAPNLLMTEVPTLLGLILLTGGWFAWMKKPRAWVALAVGGVLGAVCLIRLNPLLALPVIPVFALLAFGREKKRWAVHSLAYLLGFALLVAPWLVTGTNSDGQSYFLLKFYDVISVRYGAGVLPPEPVSRVPLPPLGGLNSLAKKPPQQEVSQFPGFVINNFMHNLVESFLVLPDSLSPLRQNLSDLEPRFYWKPETFERERLPYVAVNSLLVALGLAWSWRRWKWAGLVPLLSFLVYAFSLALAKTSGSRYLIPIDWLVYFYYGVGILTLLQFFLPVSFLTVFQEAAEPAGDVRSPFRAFGAVLTVLLLLAAVVPAADNLVPQNASLCQPEDLSAQVALRLGEEAVSGLELRKGRVLYPSIEKKVLSFVLFSCHQFTSMKMDAPFDMVNSGALVIAGWPVTEAKSEPLPITLLVPAE